MKKKKFQAIKADTGDYEGIRHDGKEYRFQDNGTFVVEDEGLAREMESIYGKKGTQKIAFAPYDDHETRELGHRYTFGPTSGFAQAWEAYERRRKRRARNVAAAQ